MSWMKVKDIMTKNVEFVNPSTTILDAAKIMKQHDVGAVPVCDQGGVVGMITDRDIVVRNIAAGGNPQNTAVRDVMSPNVATASPEMDVNDISHMMAKQQVRRVPVVENNKLIGIVALGDMAVDQKSDTEASEALTEISRPTK